MSGNDNLKEQLESIKNQIVQMRKDILENGRSIKETHIAVMESRISNLKTFVTESEFSDFTLSFSIFFSALLGVMSNFFVSLWFQPPTGYNITGLFVAGGFIVGGLGFIFVEYVRAYRKIMASTQKERQKRA